MRQNSQFRLFLIEMELTMMTLARIGILSILTITALSSNVSASNFGFGFRLSNEEHLVCEAEKETLVQTLSQGALDAELVQAAKNVLDLCIKRVDLIAAPFFSSKDAASIFNALNAAGFACLDKSGSADTSADCKTKTIAGIKKIL
jgi:hypothetical protein